MLSLTRNHLRLREWMASPLTVLLLAATVAGVCGVMVHRQAFAMLAGIGSVLGVGLFWPWLTLRGVRASVSFATTRCREGEAVAVRLHLHNRSLLPVDGLTLHGLSPLDETTHSVPPLGRRTVSWPLVLGRGQWPADGVELRCGFPFGLWHPRRAVCVAEPLLVWPARVPAPRLPQVRNADAVLRPASIGGGSECVGVRPYRRGDAVKLVHRAQTARHDRLIVREVCGGSQATLRIVLDSSAAAYPTAELREHAIRLAASLFETQLSTGSPVELLVEGVLLPRGGDRLRNALDPLARLVPAGRTALAELLARPPCRSGRDTSVVVITSTAARNSLPQSGRPPVQFILADAASLEMTAETFAPSSTEGLN